MKHLTKPATMSICLLLLLFMTNCQMDDNATVVNNSSTVAGTSKYITLKELALMPKAYQKFNSINSRSTTARGIYYQDYNFTINADLILYYSDGKTESITFEVYSDKDKGYVENLVLNKEDNGEYSVYYILYDMTYEEKLLAAYNYYVKIEKMSVQRLYDFDAVGLTNRNRSDIVMIGGNCFRRYYDVQRTDSFSGIPDQLEFSEVRGEEKFTPIPCPEPEVSLPSHPIMLPIFNPVPWNPDPIVPSPEIVIPGGVTATPFAPIKTKTIINPQILRFRNEPGFPQDLLDVYMNPDRMFGMRGRINSLIGSGKSDYDTKKDLAFRILNLAKDPENQQTALDLLDYMNENDYSEDTLNFINNLIADITSSIQNNNDSAWNLNLILLNNLGGEIISDIDTYLSPFNLTQAAKFTLYVDQPTANSKESWSGTPFNPNVGHTFISIKQGNITRVLGYYPSEGVNPYTNSSADREFINDGGHAFDVSVSLNITSHQLTKIIQYIKSAPRTYNLNSYNCTDFGMNISKLAGLNLGSAHGKWPGGAGDNPGQLGQNVRNITLPIGAVRNISGGIAPNNQ